ncbi:hypothetical protein MOK15_02750 [Sphingobium sp. BYY-5]|uniref:hypothetical protein n=1 Tax=Sphingobium sp. BYY-5 TaxID=2926400 RepID=UPI001FA75965|nr:hypothetical protein [Sphingobium sp. BYY-5]MCI4589026.1 hypothetical protein [Sphingobium sp. BYY-5]
MFADTFKNKILAFAAALPFVSTAMFFIILGNPSDWDWGTIIIAPLGFLFLMPFLGAAQLVMALYIWFSRYIPLKIIFAAASVVMLIILYRFLVSGDFTSRSTAPLGAPFYGLYLGFLAAVCGGPLIGLEYTMRWLRRRRAE